MSAERTATVAQTADCCAPLGISRAWTYPRDIVVGDVVEEVTYRTEVVAGDDLEPVPENARLQVDVEEHSDQSVLEARLA